MVAELDEKTIRYSYNRKFGAEMEINSDDCRDFKANPLQRDNEYPLGMERLAGHFINEIPNCSVNMMRYTNNHNNKSWIFKPDSSCGIEICTPVLRGITGLEELTLGIKLIKKYAKHIDDRCSFHVHVDVSDCDTTQLGCILRHWIKCEMVMLNAMQASRKGNKYCRPIGSFAFCDYKRISPDSLAEIDQLIKYLSVHKYNSLNTFHMANTKKRKTLEFRIMDKEACSSPVIAKNWVKLVVHFIEQAKKTPIMPYKEGDQFSSILVLNPADVLKFLNLSFEDNLSVGMRQTRNWFISRLHQNIGHGPSPFWAEGQSVAARQVQDLYDVMVKEKADLAAKQKDFEDENKPTFIAEDGDVDPVSLIPIGTELGSSPTTTRNKFDVTSFDRAVDRAARPTRNAGMFYGNPVGAEITLERNDIVDAPITPTPLENLYDPEPANFDRYGGPPAQRSRRGDNLDNISFEVSMPPMPASLEQLRQRGQAIQEIEQQITQEIDQEIIQENLNNDEDDDEDEEDYDEENYDDEDDIDI